MFDKKLCDCKNGELALPAEDLNGKDFCLKTFDIEIKRVSKDTFSIEDKSTYSTNDYSVLRTRKIKVKLITTQKEEFIVELSAGGKSLYSLKEYGLMHFRDGMFCACVFSCGDYLNIYAPYFENIECDFDNAILTTYEKNESKLISLKSKIDMMKRVGRCGLFEDVSKMYKNIKRMLSECV